LDEQPDDVGQREWYAPDWLLGAFVTAANSGGGDQVAMTLWTGGLLVSGTLVGVDDYFDGVAAALDEVAGSGRESLGAMFGTLGKQARDLIQAEDSESRATDTPPPDPAFIHLKNARTYLPTERPIPSGRGVWWRGRLESVDGWCLGELAES
jgi:hypothetical protein